MMARQNQRAYELIADRLTEITGYHPNGNGGDWRCPAHEDRSPSLSVTAGDDRVLVHCQAGCELDAVLDALDLKQADLFDAPLETDPDRRRIRDTYDYVDEDGRLLFQVIRFEPKTFRQRRPDGTGGWVWKLGDTRRVLYRLPQVVAAVAAGRPVFVVEGEKDVHALERAGEVATCNPMGANKWRAEHADALAGAAKVTIVRDKDPEGIKHAADVEASLVGRVDQLLIVEARSGKDAADHLAAGLTVDEFELIGEHDPQAAQSEPPAVQRHAAAHVDWSTFWSVDADLTDWLIEPFIARGRAHALYAPAKTGKSLFALAVCAAAATGRRILDQPAGPPLSVVYFDLEMTDADLRDRLIDLGYGPDVDLSNLHYYVLPALQPLDQPGGGAEVIEIARHHHADLVVIDTTARAISGPENDADTLRAFYANTGRHLKAEGRAVLRADHAGKDLERGQRGTSAKADDVDVVWRLTARDGGRFRLDATHRRMNWVPQTVELDQRADPLRYLTTEGSWPHGTGTLAERLDLLGVPVDAGRPTARKMLAEAGHEAGRNDVLAAALRYRRDPMYRPKSCPHDFGDSANCPDGTASGDSDQPTTLDLLGQLPGTAGDSGHGERGQLPPSPEGAMSHTHHGERP